MTAWEPFENLRRAIEEALAQHPGTQGVHLENWGLMPDQKAAQIILRIDPEALDTEEQKKQREFDKQFDDIRAMDAVEASKEKARNAIKGLMKISREGILPEEDVPPAE